MHANPDGLPALQGGLGSFQVRFRRPEVRTPPERYMTGLLTALPTTHGDTLAQAVPGTSAPRLHASLTPMPWDKEALTCQRVHKMIAAAPLRDGVLGLDEAGVPTPGHASVGVARQASGKVGNCQPAVPCCDTEPQASGPVAMRVSLPQAWAEARARRGQARIPAAVPFRTTPAIALGVLAQARGWGVPHGGVIADADSADHPTFLVGLESRQARSGVGERADFRVHPQRRAPSPVQRADHVLWSVNGATTSGPICRSCRNGLVVFIGVCLRQRIYAHVQRTVDKDPARPSPRRPPQPVLMRLREVLYRTPSGLRRKKRGGRFPSWAANDVSERAITIPPPRADIRGPWMDQTRCIVRVCVRQPPGRQTVRAPPKAAAADALRAEELLAIHDHGGLLGLQRWQRLVLPYGFHQLGLSSAFFPEAVWAFQMHW